MVFYSNINIFTVNFNTQTKKIFFSNLLVIFILTAALSSCSKDNDVSTQTAIIGKWTPVQFVITIPGFPPFTEPYGGNIARCNKNYTEFIVGGTAKNVDYAKVNNICTPEIDSGTWVQDGNNLKVNVGTEMINATIISLIANELKFSVTQNDMGMTATTIITFARI